MDSNSLIIGLLFAVAIGVPFLFLRRAIRKRDKQMRGKLTAMAAQKGGEISQFDLLKDIGVGLDDKQFMLFFIHDNEHFSNAQEIDLKTVRQCTVEKMTRDTVNNGIHQSTIEKVSLVFLLKSKEKGAIVLELFNTDYDSLTLAGELQLAQKWERIVNQKLASLSA